MKKVEKTGLFFTVLIVMGLMTMPVVSFGQLTKSDKVLATVGKRKITEADIYAKVSMLPVQFRARYESAEGKQKLLEQTVKFSLLSQEARSLGIDKREDVAQKIKEIADNIIIQELTKQEIGAKMSVTDEDIETHYKDNKEKFIKPEKVKVNLILFEVKADDLPDTSAKQLKKAQKTLKKLKKGEDFGALAKDMSDDKRSKKRGGSTGFFSKGKRINTYGEKFEEMAFTLKKGEMSDVFESKRGFYIIKVTDKQQEKVQTLEEVKKKIERRLKQEKQKEAYDNYLEALRKKYPVKIMN